MADTTYKLIEIVGTSKDSIEDAIRNGVAKAQETVHGFSWFEVGQIRGSVNDKGVDQFQVIVKLGMRLD